MSQSINSYKVSQKKKKQKLLEERYIVKNFLELKQ